MKMVVEPPQCRLQHAVFLYAQSVGVAQLMRGDQDAALAS
jgi:hypothetical protein